ncbi:DNA helicase B isoform X2 [Lepeophtheirus salmonis]|uniref:DNA helicase B isoform X2 n=2 Tax=Lepeophtheirus salmonis TaxID=72036 RepID=UPI001AE7FE69|nr:DNA helicase B-like isoform X2 [Lepeophtheirus salmonis]
MKSSNFNRVQVWVQFVESRTLTADEFMDLEDSGELDDEEEDFNSYGPNSVPSIRPQYRRVSFNIKTDRVSTISIVSKAFVWTYSWMKCLISVFKSRGDIAWSIRRGFFEPIRYELNNSLGLTSISKFLSCVDDVSSNAKSFEDHLRRKYGSDIRLSRFWDLLDDWPDKRAIEMKEQYLKSPAGKILLLAQDKPNLFVYGALLFRNKFLSLLSKNDNEDEDSPADVSSQEKLLSDLEYIFSQSYWSLGFNDVLYKCTGRSGLEVRLKSLKMTNFYDKLEPIHQHALEIYDGFKSKCYQDGHTYLTRRNLELFSKGFNNDLDDILKFLKKHNVISIDETLQIYQLSRFKQAEMKIIAIFKSLLLKPYWTIDFNEKQFKDLTPDKEQRKATKMIAHNPITVISGRGGTGKTEIVTTVLSSLNEIAQTDEDESKSDDDEIDQTSVLYVAPTGKAASVIRHRIKSKAYTIHQIIASHKKFLENRMKAESGPWKYATIKVIVVDECSMVGMCDAELKKVILLGDVLQLPSIDPGNLMSDIYQAFKSRSYSIELVTNHRSEGSLIFNNAKRISKKIMPVFHDDDGFHLIEPIWDEKGLSKRCGTLKKLLKQDIVAEDVNPSKINAYLQLLVDKSIELKVDCQNKSQIITFTRKECELLNKLCCKIYNDHYIFSYYNGRKLKTLVQNDKIICTKNKDVPLLTIHNNVIVKRKEDRLMNGSVFIIDSLKSYKGLSREEKEGENVTESESSSALSYELDNLQGEKIYVEKKIFDKLCKPCHAWALTIHKFQGSETDTIVYSVSNSRNENWQHVYTAITRGKKKVIIIGSKLHLEAAILRDPKPRQTRLKSLLDDLLNSLSDNPRKNNVDDEIASTISDEKNDTSLLSDDLSMVDESSFQDTELDSSLWQDNESFDIMLSQMDATTDNDAWQNDSFDQVLSQIQYDSGDVTPPNSPLSKQRMTCLTPEMSSKLKLSMG